MPTADGDGAAVPEECEALHRSLRQCHRRVAGNPSFDYACRHLSRSLAECLVTVACPSEADAVLQLCGSGGTALKRSQCRQAQISLSLCLSSHQSQS